MYLKKGDIVIVIAGSNKGKEGSVLRTLKDDDKVLVEGVNIRTKHVKPKQKGEKGSIQKQEAPIHVSNVALIDPKTKKPARVGFLMEKGKKTRVIKS